MGKQNPETAPSRFILFRIVKNFKQLLNPVSGVKISKILKKAIYSHIQGPSETAPSFAAKTEKNDLGKRKALRTFVLNMGYLAYQYPTVLQSRNSCQECPARQRGI